jgi:hypothetical protein
VLAVAIYNLAWETAQLPLYTLRKNGTSWQIIFAVLHCTAGDVLIAIGALFVALLAVGVPGWPETRIARTAFATLAAGLCYTVYSEYLNTTIRNAWAYSDLMPTLPWLGTGLAPLAQWIVVPSLSLAYAARLPAGQSRPRRTRTATHE